MVFLIRSKLRTPFVRYLLAGGVSYVIEIGSILVLLRFLNFTDIASVAVSFWAGLLASFGLQKLLVFSSKTTKKRTLHQLLLYLCLVAFNYGFTLGMVALLSPAVHVTIARSAALLVTTIWNFIFYSKIIFRHENSTIPTR